MYHFGMNYFGLNLSLIKLL